MDIVYDGVVAKQDRYKYSVKQNNKSNIIIFKLAKQQDSITLNPNNHFYIKVRNSGRTFTDKDPNVVVEENDATIFVSWTMLRKVTQFKDIDVQVEYYDSENDIKWQTAIVNINLHDNIPVDEEIESKYPSILAQLQKQIDELKVDVLPTVAGTGIKIVTKNDKKVISVDEDVVASKEDLKSKVDKVEGKGLSSNDYTNEEKQEVAKIKDKVDKITGKGLSTNDYTNSDKEAVSEIPNKVDKEANKSLMSQEEHSKLAGIENNATRTIVVASTQNGYIVVNDGQVKVYDDTEVRELITGKKTAWVIDTEDQITGLKDADGNFINVTKIGNLNMSLIKVGDDIYIKDDDVPDYWVTSREVEEGVVILSLHKSNTKINLDDYYTKEEIDELIKNLDNIIISNKKPKLTESALNKLHRHKDINGNVKTLCKVNKEVTPAGDVTSNCNTTKNGTQISNYTAFNGYFDTDLNELYGEDFSISEFTNIYTAYYPNIEDSPVSAIRIGTKNPGSINLVNFSKSKLKIIAGKYFSYNGSTQQKTYDANSKLVITWNDGESTTIDLTEDPTTYEVDLTDFDSSYPVEIYASGSSSDGRAFIYGFVAEGEEEIDYSSHDLATEDDIQKVNERIDETNNDVQAVDAKVDQVDTRVDSVDLDLQSTKETIGHVQIFNAKYLPRASRDYIDKILRVNGVLYQLKVNGEEKEYSFENVSGTSEVKGNTWDDFAALVTNGFSEDFELAYTENADWVTPIQLTAGKEYRTNNLPDGDVNFFHDTGLNNITITNGYDKLLNATHSYPFNNIDFLMYEGGNFFAFDDTEDIDNGEIYPETSSKPQVYFTCNDPTGFDPQNVGAINYLEEKQISKEYLISKIFRNDGYAKFGSSSVGGKLTIRKINDRLPNITKVVLKLKTWSATKNAGIISSVGAYSADNVVSANEEVQNVTIYNGQDSGSTDVISLESYRPDAGDIRFNLAGMIVTFGEASYEWAPIGGGSGGGTDKYIELSTRKEIVFIDPEDPESDIKYTKKYLRINLHNFDITDVGKTINLEVYTKKNQKLRKIKRWIHPINCGETGPYRGLGYKNVASSILYGEAMPVADWMPNEGLSRTEWEITNSDIQNGYKEIDLGYWLLDIVNPDYYDPENGLWLGRKYNKIITSAKYIIDGIMTNIDAHQPYQTQAELSIDNSWIIEGQTYGYAKDSLTPNGILTVHETHSQMYDYSNSISAPNNVYRIRVDEIYSKNTFEIFDLEHNDDYEAPAFDDNDNIFVEGSMFGIGIMK